MVSLEPQSRLQPVRPDVPFGNPGFRHRFRQVRRFRQVSRIRASRHCHGVTRSDAPPEASAGVPAEPAAQRHRARPTGDGSRAAGDSSHPRGQRLDENDAPYQFFTAPQIRQGIPGIWRSFFSIWRATHGFLPSSDGPALCIRVVCHAVLRRLQQTIVESPRPPRKLSRHQT